MKDFSKIAKPLYKLLEKDAKFVWEKECQEGFEELKSHLTTAPIVRAPNWQLPFEVMCDASDLANWSSTWPKRRWETSCSLLCKQNLE